jgi:hypothetical protein
LFSGQHAQDALFTKGKVGPCVVVRGTFAEPFWPIAGNGDSVTAMAPITDPGYAAAKQRRYRERLRAREEEEAIGPLTRATISLARAQFTPDKNAERVARMAWPNDPLTLGLLQRAATAPATAPDAAWAGPLTTLRVQELLKNLGPLSIGSELLQRGIVLTFDGNFQINVPGITVDAKYASFVGEGQPIPVHQMAVTGGAVLQPRKFATIVALTREMIVSSNAQELVQAVLVDAIAASLDAHLFDSTAGDSTRPAGLLVGVTPITAATGGGSAAMLKDLSTLATDVAPYGGLDIVYVTDPGTAVKLTFAMGPQFKIPVMASSGIPANTVICLAPNALCSASDPAPRIDASRDAVEHMEDSVPAQLVSTGGVMAVPIKSSFQTDSVSIRLVMFVAWATRATGAIAYVPSVTW